MAYTYSELKSKTVAELREIAKGLKTEAVKGYTQMNKEHLLAAICEALNLDMHVHHKVVGVNKRKIKTRIKELKKIRAEALAAHDHAKLIHIRGQIKSQKQKLRRATV
jgi:hypothetical protein